MQHTLAVLGECMLELNLSEVASESAGAGNAGSGRNGLPANLSYGGDTLNTALYLSRLDVSVNYVTALGDDNLSQWMLDQWRSEGINCELVDRHAASAPGLYLIETDASGERTFTYWRDRSPASRMLDDPHKAAALFSQLISFRYIYLSGITLGIYSQYARECLFDFLATFRNAGGKVIFDGNYRPKLWSSNSLTKQAYKQMYRLTDIALPTMEDEQALFGDTGPDHILQRLSDLGVGEIVLKMGGEGCLVDSKTERSRVPGNKVAVVDTTAAGDSFNAGYLAARLAGSSMSVSAKAGHDLASIVIQHKGAIIPRRFMPDTENAA